MLGLEVEGYEDLAKKYENFVVGEVLERAKHPNADRLSICKVNIGTAVQEVVCRCSQCSSPDKKLLSPFLVPFIRHNQHDPEGKPYCHHPSKRFAESSPTE